MRLDEVFAGNNLCEDPRGEIKADDDPLVMVGDWDSDDIVGDNNAGGGGPSWKNANLEKEALDKAKGVDSSAGSKSKDYANAVVWSRCASWAKARIKGISLQLYEYIYHLRDALADLFSP